MRRRPRPRPPAQAATGADSAASSTLAATAPAADSAAADTVGWTPPLADSIRKAREIEVMRETFAYSGGARDPFDSLLNIGSTRARRSADLELVGVYQDLRNAANSVVVLREKVAGKRYKLRVG